MDTPTAQPESRSEKPARARPRRAADTEVSRAASEAALAIVSRMGSAASYRGAERRRTDSSRPRQAGGTFDSHLDRLERDRLRRDARDLMRNDPIAEGVIERCVGLIVGRGFKPKPKTKSEGFDEWLAEKYAAWATDPEARGLMSDVDLQQALVRQALVDGDTPVLKLDDPRDRVQVTDAERLRNPGGKADSEEWRDGVKVDKLGRPVAYNIADWSKSGRSLKDPERPYDAKDVLMVARVKWASQTRGESRLGKLTDEFGRLMDYIQSTEDAAHLFALMTLVHFTDDPDGVKAGYGAQNGTDDRGYAESRAQVQPGQVNTFGINDKVVGIQPEQPTATFEEFVRVLLRRIGSGLGVPYELMMLDFGVSNYHGSLAALEAAWREVEMWQEWFESRVLRKLYRWLVARWIAREVEAGKLGQRDPRTAVLPPDPYAHDWVPPARLVLDPKRQAEVHELRLRNRLDTYERVLGGEGHDWQKDFAQHGAEQDEMKKLGISVANLPGAKPAGGPAGGPGGEGGSQPAHHGPNLRLTEGS